MLQRRDHGGGRFPASACRVRPSWAGSRSQVLSVTPRSRNLYCRASAGGPPIYVNYQTIWAASGWSPELHATIVLAVLLEILLDKRLPCSSATRSPNFQPPYHPASCRHTSS